MLARPAARTARACGVDAGPRLCAPGRGQPPTAHSDTSARLHLLADHRVAPPGGHHKIAAWLKTETFRDTASLPVLTMRRFAGGSAKRLILASNCTDPHRSRSTATESSSPRPLLAARANGHL